MRNLLIILLILITTSNATIASGVSYSAKDEVFLIDDKPFDVHKSRIEEIREAHPEYNEYGFREKFK